MGAGIDQEVDLLGAVMDGMEAPEERDLVAQAMTPVIADLPRHQPGERARPERQRSGRRKKATRNGAVHGPGQHADGTLRSNAGSRLLEKVVAEIARLGLEVGDKVEILAAGAYTASYASVGFNGFAPIRTYCI